MHPHHDDTPSPASGENGRQPWPKIGIPIPPALSLMKASVNDKPGTYAAGSLAGYIATGATHGTSTWAIVIIAIGMLAAETIQKIKNPHSL